MEGLFLRAMALKGSTPNSELKEEYAQTPNINILVVEVSLHNFWGHIIESSTEGLAFAELRDKY